MAKKIKLSQQRKDFLKVNFFKVKPDKLKPNERAYYNKIKAGKARAGSVKSEKGFQDFRDRKGRFMTKQFVQDEIIRIAKKMGVTPRELWRESKEEIQTYFETHKIQWWMNEKSVNSMEKRYEGDFVAVKSKKGSEFMPVLDYKERFHKFKQHINWKAARDKQATSMPYAIYLPTEIDLRSKNMKVEIPSPEELKGMTYSEIKKYLKENYPDINIVES